MLVPSVLEQKVTGTEARRSWRELCRRFGEPAPGPAPDGLRVPPTPGADPRRAGLGVAPGRRRLGTSTRDPRLRVRRPAAGTGRELGGVEGRTLLRRVPGIGVWTAAEVAQRVWGDADAVSYGDFHIPTVVGWALLGRPIDDTRWPRSSPPTRRTGSGRCGSWSCRASSGRGSGRGSPRGTTARSDQPRR